MIIEDVSKRIIHGSRAVFIGKIGILLVTFLFTPIFVRVIGKENYGIFATIMGIYGLIFSVSILGLQDSARKHIAQYKYMENGVSKMASFSLLLAICAGILSALLGFIIISYLYYYKKIDLEWFRYWLIVLFTLIFANIVETIGSVLYGIYLERYVTIILLVRKVSFFVFAILLVFSPLGFTGVFIGYAIGEIIGVIVAKYRLRGRVRLSLKWAVQGYREIGMKIVRFGVMNVIGVLSAVALLQSDIIIVQLFKGEAASGALKAAHVSAELILLTTVAFQVVMLTNCAELWETGRRKELIDLGKSIWKYSFLILLLLSVGLWILAPSFIDIYFGVQFHDSILPLRILLPGIFAYGLAQVLNPFIVGSGWICINTILILFVVILNIMLNIYLVPKYGIAGAAAGTSISLGLFLAISIIILHFRRLNIVKQFPILKNALFAVLFMVLFAISNKHWPFGETLRLICGPIIGVSIFALLASSLRIVSIKEVRSFINYNNYTRSVKEP